MKNFQALINNSLKNLRISTGLSQEKFSEICGINADNYRNLEYNKHMPKPATIDRICKSFNLNVFELLNFGLDNETNLQNEILTGIKDLNEKQLRLIHSIIKVVREQGSH